MSPKKKKGGGGGGGGDAAEERPQSAPATKPEPPPEDADDADEVEEDATQGKKREGADISKVTDFVEQKELDHAKASQAIAALMETESVDAEAEAEREKELAAVQINQADVELIATEMELDKAVAERKLREHNGDAVQTLVTLVSE